MSKGITVRTLCTLTEKKVLRRRSKVQVYNHHLKLWK